jgi:perosamine synthetase
VIPYGRQSVDEADIAAVVEVLRGDWLTQGPTVESFEAAVAERTGARHAVAFANGTAALHGACAVAELGPGSQVATSTLSFVASANCARYVGAEVVLLDIDPATLNVDPTHVPDGLDGLVAVHFAGLPVDLAQLAVRPRVVIEDAAHALGATYRGRPVGADADLAVFSFHPVKHATTGEGGAVTASDAGRAERARRFRNHGIASTPAERRDWRYDMVDLGFNYRLTDLQCALGLSQLTRLPRALARREAIAVRYRAAFAGMAGLTLPVVAPDVRHAWHIFPVLLDLERLRADREAVFAALRAEGIGVNVHYVPVYWHSYYRERGYRRGLCPVAERAYERLLTLPLFPTMSDGDADDVVTAVAKVLGHYAR